MPSIPDLYDGGLQSDIPFQELHVHTHSHAAYASRSNSIASRSFSQRMLRSDDASLLPPSGLRADWVLISISFRSGALLLLLFWVLWDCIVDTHVHPSSNNFWVDAVIPIYRATGFLIMAYWMWGLNVYVWRKYHINYMFLFELDPRTSDTHRKIFSNAITISIVYLVDFLFYFKMQRGDFMKWCPPGIWPMSLFVLILLIMVPWPFCGTPLKQWPVAFCEVLMAPFRPVKFLHVFIGDVLTSLVKPGIDVAYSLCFLGTGLWLVRDLENNSEGRQCLDSFTLTKVFTPIISAMPLWLRLLQCLRRYYDTRDRFPHVVNAGKYATAQSVIIVGVFHASLAKGAPLTRAAWIITLTCSTMYSYLWDVFMDWDLGRKEWGRLRSTLVYRSRTFYYSAIVLDLFFRFAWALTFVPASAESPLGDWYLHSLTPVVSGMEVIRRGVWSLIRVENEHLTQMSQKEDDAASAAAHEAIANQLTHGLLEDDAEEVQDEVDATQRKKQKGWMLLLEIAGIIAIVLAVALVSYFTN